ncbi:MAG: LacI family transcriptional regulator [Cytophagales bacterium]|nr:LacI family transcriptional regulator [Cytophagales bacterium]
MKKTSIKDIAKHLNVSVPTVSLVMNGRGDEKRISQETQKKILDYAKAQNYKPNVFAKGLKKGRSEMIGLIIPNISDVFYARIASRIEKEAAKQGYTVIYSSSEESGKKERELIRSMLDRQVEGLIIASTQKNEVDILELKRMNFPFVLVDRHYPNIETDYVIVDNKGGTDKAVSHLLSCGMTKIGFVTLTPELDAIKNRFLGYKSALENHGIAFNPGYVQELNVENYEQEMYGAIDRLINSEPPIDSILFTTHFLTAFGLRELRARQIRVPEDVKIISYGQYSVFDLIEPPITAVTQPVLDMGDQAVDILLGKLKGRSNENSQVVLETDFISRKSCCDER